VTSSRTLVVHFHVQLLFIDVMKAFFTGWRWTRLYLWVPRIWGPQCRRRRFFSYLITSTKVAQDSLPSGGIL